MKRAVSDTVKRLVHVAAQGEVALVGRC